MRAPMIALMLAPLAACGPQAGVKGLCTPFETADAKPAAGVPAPSAAAADASAPLEDCLHRWAYSLAGSSDPADQVASATVAACAGQLSAWNREALAPAATAPAQALSLMTGEPVSPMTAHREFAESRALFYVVQARAGHCALPPPARPRS
ncbi:MAG TPA: hypothetical protein PLG07_12650 [Phenylobacterium sp.]|nr:hypothetical protein [Phenylobacterium sp.]